MVNLLFRKYSSAKRWEKPRSRQDQAGESICLLWDHGHIPQVDQMYCYRGENRNDVCVLLLLFGFA